MNNLGSSYPTHSVLKYNLSSVDEDVNLSVQYQPYLLSIRRKTAPFALFWARLVGSVRSSVLERHCPGVSTVLYAYSTLSPHTKREKVPQEVIISREEEVVVNPP